MQGREIIVGVTGGVAAYKSAALVSQLVQAGAGVTVVLTKAGEAFVGESTFAALTGRPVETEIFAPSRHPLGAHIKLAEQADALCIAPATAATIANLAHGHADDLLSTLYLAYDGPVLLAPAMNNAMWEKPSVQRNIKQLEADGVTSVGPNEGWLSCRQKGAGRMAEPNEIVAALQHLLAK